MSKERIEAQRLALKKPLMACVGKKWGHLVGIPPKLRDYRDPIFDLVRKAHQLTAVEVGTLQGWFAWRMAKYLPDDARVFCVDPFLDDPENGYDGEYNLTCWKKNTREHFGKRIFLKRGPSVEVASTWPENSVDFLFVDGDHAYEAVLADLRAWWPRVRQGGLIAGHDTTGPHGPAVMKALDVFGSEKKIPEINLQKIYSFTGTQVTECFWFYKAGAEG